MTDQQLEESEQRSVRKLDITSLKKFAATDLPQGSELRELLLAQTDCVTVDEFIHAFPIWMQLLKIESKRKVGF